MRLAEPVTRRARPRYDEAGGPIGRPPVVACGIHDPRAETTVVAVAADLARRLDGTVLLVHVQPPPLITLEPQVAYATAQPDPARELHAAACELACVAADTGLSSNTQLYVAFGDPEERLLAEARKSGAALIVVGSTTASRSRRRSLARVIERANCPVVVAGQDPFVRRSDWGEQPIVAGRAGRDTVAMSSIEGGDEMTTSIICGVDGSQDARLALRLAAELASRFRVRLVVAHVVQPPVPAPGLGPTARQLETVPLEALLAGGEAFVDQILAEEDVRQADRRVVLGFPADRLADLADEEAAELIVVGSRGRGPFKAAFLGSVSTDLIAVARCPVLVVPPAASAGITDRQRSQSAAFNGML